MRSLDIWTADLCGVDELTRQTMDAYTRDKLTKTLRYAVENSMFYKRKYGKLFQPDRFLGEESFGGFLRLFRELPFTTREELLSRGQEFLCVSPAQISRIVTLDTGGSTGSPKRISFTEADQQLTVDYFCHGMQLLVDSGDKVLILMPAKVPGSIGKLLARGLRDFGAGAVEYGLPRMTPSMPEEARKCEAERLLRIMKEEGVASAVALPTHMRMLAEAARGFRDAVRLKTVLLSAEYVPEEDAAMIRQVFGCRVYEHYGMTEMGLGCAVSCGYGRGYHVREADLYLEIIDPDTGRNAEDGRYGEIVFTTLTREGMPFIRYRTGDYSRWLTEPCGCGSILKRLDKVGPRDVIKGYLR